MSVSSPAPNAPEAVRGADALWAVKGTIAPSPVSLLYKLGLAAVALMMVLLPVLYIAIIAATAYAVYDHALDPWYSLGSSIWALLAYLAPIVAGTILVFFMIKPLFARRAKSVEPVAITAEEEPELFRFVGAICAVVRAPRPRRVLIDLQVNASASFRRGMLSLLGRDLTLTIGLPLVAGLSIREFGGVLAHEFGHFAQGAGMRLTFIVRSVNNWFARVVYERDAWDERLRETANRIDFRIGVMLQLARGMIWLTRRILWALMMVGHGISSFMLRQMEFDADRFETQVAGSDGFAATTRRLHELSVAWHRTMAQQQDAFLTKRLVDDLPDLVALETNRLSRDTRERMEQSLAAATTGWFDTHPADRDRLEASRALAAPGVLRGDAPATMLFADFAATAQKRTLSYYRDECGIELNDVRLHSLTEMSGEAAAAAEEEECAARWFGPLLTVRTFISLDPESVASASVSTEAAPLRQRHEVLLREAEAIIDRLLKADGEEVIAMNARALLNAGFVINKKDFGLTQPTVDAADEKIADARSRCEQELKNLKEALDVTRDRLTAALSCYRAAGDRTGTREEVGRLLEIAVRFDGIAGAVLELRNRTAAAELLLINSPNATHASLWNVTARELTDAIEQSIATVLDAFRGFDYPFTHARGVVPLPEFLDEAHAEAQRIPRAFLRGRAVLERTFALYARVMRRVAVLAEHADSLVEQSSVPPDLAPATRPHG